MARLMERDISPANAWQVLLDDNGDLYWVNSVGKMESQPARGSSQRVMDAIFKIFPKDQVLSGKDRRCFGRATIGPR